jgi:two-component system cell cycle sensor histidine kinase/response regulator CckA
MREAALRSSCSPTRIRPSEQRAAVVRNLDPWYAAFSVQPGQKALPFARPARAPLVGWRAPPPEAPSGWSRWPRPRAASAALLLWALASPVFAACFFAGALALGVPLALLGGRRSAEPAEAELVLDRALLRAALEGGAGPLAVTDLKGASSPPTRPMSRRSAPPRRPASPDGDLLEAARPRRLGRGDQISRRVSVALAGGASDRLLWRLERVEAADVEGEARRLVTGEAGERLGQAGIMAALVDRRPAAHRQPRLPRPRLRRAGLGAIGGPLADLFGVGEDGRFHFAREGKAGGALRIVQVPVDGGERARSSSCCSTSLGGGDVGANPERPARDPPARPRAGRPRRPLRLSERRFRRAAGLSRSAARPGRATSSSTRTRPRSPIR